MDSFVGFNCASCGKPLVGRSVMDTLTEGALCLVCASVRKEKRRPASNREPATSDGAPLQFPRLPAEIKIHFPDASGVNRTYSYPATAVSLSVKGICFEWNSCSQCWGYEPNGVHPSCFFNRYVLNRPDSVPVDVSVQLHGATKVEASMKIVYTLFDASGVEFIGAQFIRIGARALDLLTHYIAEIKAQQDPDAPTDVPQANQPSNQPSEEETLEEDATSFFSSGLGGQINASVIPSRNPAPTPGRYPTQEITMPDRDELTPRPASTSNGVPANTLPADLARVIAAWDYLPDHIKHEILRRIESE